MGKYKDLATEIVKNVGGKENINSLTHCITRLRFRLKDESKANDEAIKNMDGVVTLMKSGGQYQVVIGNHVPRVYEDVVEVAGLSDDNTNQEDEKQGLFNKFIALMSDVFQPILGALSASGIIKGLVALLGFIVVGFKGSGNHLILNAIGDGLFNFLPFMIAYSASRKFKLNPVTGLAMAGILLYPAIQKSALEANGVIGSIPYVGDYYSHFLGMPFVANNYAGSVIPILTIIAFGSVIERKAKDLVPDVLQGFFVPFFTLIITMPIALLIIGPVISTLTNLLMEFFKSIIGISPVLFGLIIGFVWQILVIFGLHWSIIPLGIIAIQANGMDRIMVGQFGASFAQTAVVFAMYLKMKDKKKKSLALPAIISGIFGVTEPAIYGFSLPAKKPFIFSCIGGGISGAIFMLMGGTRYNQGGLGIFGIMNYVNPENGSFIPVLLDIVIAAAIGFILTMFFWKPEEEIEESVNKENNNSLVGTNERIFAPMTGEVLKLSEINDQAFSSEALGKGLAINPTDGKVYSPVDGTITMLFRTNHAVGITSNKGVEILIHIGMDTVEMDGNGFLSHVKQGDKIKAGDLLIEVDLEKVKKSGYETITPILVTNYDDLLDLVGTDQKEIKAKEDLLTALF
ncbi:beta-glucoside-specific PTS transporter subunit IIABC [Anaerococcus sp. NML200537]|uniref:beta-glucoside-specific PTS transporter subunit IIABC n=1 Tax=Anaerococcus sp. NML200537 TaxID=2954485 RepID=UPI002238EACE|nr:beta-glucoside-specific PTS transporter subunit IIABC [Anaerococcus sp. NML200537]MCW6701148.1 beta-glucoside-specific PTS transporter subunit IIABC [Anaerococcus sp. NML200537]